MKTLGFTKVVLLPLMISGTIMGSSIASPIPPHRSPTSEESTSCRRENRKEQSVELQASQTGRRYYGSSEDLKQDIRRDGKDSFRREIISPSHNPWKSKLRRDKTIIFKQCFNRSLDDGTPKYYNSNILGRYMRKDYGNFESNSKRLVNGLSKD